MSLAVRSITTQLLNVFPGLAELNIGMLLAAPKKKTSHQKKRQRLLADNANRNNVKFLNNLNKCPSCGHFKRMNTLCPCCVGEIRHIWKAHLAVKEEVKESVDSVISEVDKRILYPGRVDTAYMRKLKDKDSYLKRRTKTLPVERNQ